MKLNELSRYRPKSRSALKEALDELDINAKEELDGKDLDTDLEVDMDPVESELESGLKDREKPQESNNDYGIKNISDQLDGMIEHWFQIAQNIDPSKKESFLKLGDRLSELSEVLKAEFIDAR